MLFNKNKKGDLFSNSIGIDLGTANILVYLKGVGIVIDEPSVIAINKKTNRVIAVGHEAKKMLGRTPEYIMVERPIKDGVISNFDVAGEMITYLVDKVEREYSKKVTLFGPKVVIGVPTGITNVETRAARDAAMNAGARKVYVVEEPLAAAIGGGLPVNSSQGVIIVDIGGGTSDVAVISLGGIVNSKKILIAGDKLNNDIIDYLKTKHKILIGENTAERIKMNTLSLREADEENFELVRGRDLVTGLAKEIKLKSGDLKKAISSSLDVLIDGIKEVVETTPPEILATSYKDGIYLSGGGALIQGLDEFISASLKMPVKLVEDPFLAVVNGTATILEDIDKYKDSILSEEDEITF